MAILFWILQSIFVPLVSPLFIGIVRKIKAKFQKRRGASIFQPYRDLLKLFKKNETISKDASWIFRFAPYLIFAVTVVVGLSIPIFSTFTANPYTTDILIIIYLLALGTFFLALSGMDTGNAFGGFGSSREMTLSSLAEGGMLLALFATAVVAKSSNVFSIAESIEARSFFMNLPLIISFIGFIIVFLAENSRYPFDNPATHLELTMVHEAMILENSGKGLALLEWASANKFLIFMILGANLFFPFGISENLVLKEAILGLLVIFGKMIILAFIVAVIESAMAKFRYFRLPDLLFTAVILSIISLGLIK